MSPALIQIGTVLLLLVVTSVDIIFCLATRLAAPSQTLFYDVTQHYSHYVKRKPPVVYFMFHCNQAFILYSAHLNLSFAAKKTLFIAAGVHQILWTREHVTP